MGCANSMPLMNGNGGMVEAAKSAVTDTMHAGEEALQGKKFHNRILPFISIIASVFVYKLKLQPNYERKFSDAFS